MKIINVTTILEDERESVRQVQRDHSEDRASRDCSEGKILQGLSLRSVREVSGIAWWSPKDWTKIDAILSERPSRDSPRSPRGHESIQ